MAQSTWAAATETWATTSYIWDNTTLSDSITLAMTGDISNSNTAGLVADAVMTTVNLTQLNEEDIEKIASALFANSLGTTATASVAMPVTGTIANELDIINNVNFEERGTIAMTSSQSSQNNFLWNDVQEDTSSTWTKVADPDE